MAIGDPDLTPEEQVLAATLEGLADDPSSERRARIMAAVRDARVPRPARVPLRRVLAGVAVALVLLAASSAGVIAASADALPSSPNYPLRGVGERIRLTFGDPATREQLRVSFARSRISQAQSLLPLGDRTDAKQLLVDSRQYLADARQDVGSLSPDEQGQVQNQIDQAEEQQNQAEAQLNQSGEQGQNGV